MPTKTIDERVKGLFDKSRNRDIEEAAQLKAATDLFRDKIEPSMRAFAAQLSESAVGTWFVGGSGVELTIESEYTPKFECSFERPDRVVTKSVPRVSPPFEGQVGDQNVPAQIELAIEKWIANSLSEKVMKPR